jgi:hypothetical protein
VAHSPEQIAEAYRILFLNTESGRIVLEDLKARFHNQSTVVIRRDSGIDPLEVAYREGQRNIYCSIVEMCEPPSTLTVEENA